MVHVEGYISHHLDLVQSWFSILLTLIVNASGTSTSEHLRRKF